MSWPSWLRRQFPPNRTRVRIPGPSKRRTVFQPKMPGEASRSTKSNHQMPLPAEKALFTHAGTSAHADTPAPSSGAASWEAETQSTLYLPPTGSEIASSSAKAAVPFSGMTSTSGMTPTPSASPSATSKDY